MVPINRDFAILEGPNEVFDRLFIFTGDNRNQPENHLSYAPARPLS